MIQTGGDWYDNLNGTTLRTCCRDNHQSCYEFDQLNECNDQIANVTCLPCHSNFTSNGCNEASSQKYRDKYINIENESDNMFELKILRVHHEISDWSECDASISFTTATEIAGCEAGMKLISGISIEGVTACGDLSPAQKNKRMPKGNEGQD